MNTFEMVNKIFKDKDFVELINLILVNARR